MTLVLLAIGGGACHMTLTTPLHAHCLLWPFPLLSPRPPSSPLIHFLKAFQCLESLNLKSLSSHLEALKKTQNRPFQKNKSHSSLVSVPSLICTSVLVMLTDPFINFEFLPV